MYSVGNFLSKSQAFFKREMNYLFDRGTKVVESGGNCTEDLVPGTFFGNFFMTPKIMALLIGLSDMSSGRFRELEMIITLQGPCSVLRFLCLGTTRHCNYAVLLEAKCRLFLGLSILLFNKV